MNKYYEGGSKVKKQQARQTMQQQLREIITPLDVFTRGGLHLKKRQHHGATAFSNTQLFGQHWLRKIALKRLSNKSAD